MRQVFLNKGAIALKEVCEPALDDHSILVSVYHSLIIPETEQPIINQSKEERLLKNIPDKIKMIFNSISSKNVEGATDLIRKYFYGNIKSLGHSCSGKIIAVGKKVTQFRVGDYVACAGNGFANHADIVSIPESFAIKVHNKSLLQEASFIAVGGMAFQAVKKARLQIGQTVCVVGLDLLGLLIAQIAKLSGCKVVGIDAHEFNLEKARQVGITTVLNQKENIEQELACLTNHFGVDCTIITKYTDDILKKSITIAKQQGNIVLSAHNHPLQINYDQCFSKEISMIHISSTLQEELMVSQDYDRYAHVVSNMFEYSSTFDQFMSLLEEDLIKIKPLISHVINVNVVHEAYQKLSEKPVLGLILNFLPKPDLVSQDLCIEKIGFVPAKKEALHVGIVGASIFTQNILMPALSKIKKVTIEVAADKNIVKALNIAQSYGGARKTIINEQELFDDEHVNVVFINSPYRLDCQQAIRAMEKGKAVFLEKPMATDLEQLNTLYTYLEKNRSAQFCVDYNRSFAPFIKKIEAQIKLRKSPVIMSYRMNVGCIAKEQWLLRQMGSGRLIGEACHIFDMFLYLVDSQPVGVSVESLKPTHNYLFPTDNFTVQISFADGSICTLLYTSLGHVGIGKERMEVFFDSKTIIMDDYVSLEGYGLPLSFNENVKQPNRGETALIHNFLSAIKKDSYVPPIAIERLKKATELTLIIDQLALKGGGDYTLHQ